MDDNEVKNALKNLPRGTVTAVAKRTGFSRTTVDHVLRGKISSSKEPEILKAVAEFLIECRDKQKEATNTLRQAITTCNPMFLSPKNK